MRIITITASSADTNRALRVLDQFLGSQSIESIEAVSVQRVADEMRSALRRDDRRAVD